VLPIDLAATSFPLKSEDGHPILLTHLDMRAWRVVHDFFGDELQRDLYLAILYLRVLARQWRNKREVEAWARRSKLVNPDFFDPAKYEAKSPQTRLAAAIAWAIAAATGRVMRGGPDGNLKAVAFCLAAPMVGGDLYPAR
jgi:hypothetical protein